MDANVPVKRQPSGCNASSAPLINLDALPDDWKIFPWNKFPAFSISERAGVKLRRPSLTVGGKDHDHRELVHDESERPQLAQTSWVWQHGFDIQARDSPTKRKWVCRPCLRKPKPKTTDFSAVGTQNIEKHLFREHGLVDESGKRKPPALWKGMQEKTPSRNILEMLDLDTSDPKEQSSAARPPPGRDPRALPTHPIRLLVSLAGSREPASTGLCEPDRPISAVVYCPENLFLLQPGPDPGCRYGLAASLARLFTPAWRLAGPEWEVWIEQVPSKDDMTVKNPLARWVDRRHVWPILSKLALNIFSTPAMSAEPERVFSDGSELITDKRNGLGDDAVEAEMIQKNWITSKILRGIPTPRGLYKLPD
ncbi:hypothetical protein MRS44_018283 [Fusarium solani]|uniref:uncharacterized protein n=1 Tax=Fusarium solani TaxID=169388 RepID=UPI0032C46D33|nr:hypothetical protein MRS44_018283 [Fusarium solani]